MQSTAFAGYYFIFVIESKRSLWCCICTSWFSLFAMLILFRLLITNEKEEKHGKISQHGISFKCFDIFYFLNNWSLLKLSLKEVHNI